MVFLLVLPENRPLATSADPQTDESLHFFNSNSIQTYFIAFVETVSTNNGVGLQEGDRAWFVRLYGEIIPEL